MKHRLGHRKPIIFAEHSGAPDLRRQLGLTVIAKKPCDSEPQATWNDLMLDVPEMVTGFISGTKFPFIFRGGNAQVFARDVSG